MLTVAPQIMRRILAISLISSLLFGCQLLKKPTNEKIIVEDTQSQPPINQDHAINLAITKLEQGETQLARQIINDVLKLNKQHPTALLLLRLLDVPAETFFKTSRVIVYTVKPGDSLGSIAETWLGNSLYFISLAQMNEIHTPTRIKPGMTLKIPVIKISPLVQKEKRRSSANLTLIEHLNNEKKYYQALEKSNTLFILEEQLSKLQQLHQQTLAEILDSSVSISDRYNMLKKINQIAKSNNRDSLKNQYRQFVSHQTHNVLLDEFFLLLDDQSYLDSADKLITAKSYLLTSGKLEESDERIHELIDKLHEEAIIFRKNQELNQAMIRWEKILAIDPDNKLAKKYHSRTSKLLTKLKQLN